MPTHTFRVLSFVLLLGMLPMASSAADVRRMPDNMRRRTLSLYENPPAAERDIRLSPGWVTSLQLLDGPGLDLKNTQVQGANGRLRLSEDADTLELHLELTDSLEPGERLPLSLAYQDGTRLELTLVEDSHETDLRVQVLQHPPPSQAQVDADLARSLVEYALAYERRLQSRHRFTCNPVPQEAPRAGPSQPSQSVSHCEPIDTRPLPRQFSWLHRREGVGHLTLGDGGREVWLMGNDILYQMHQETVLLVSVFNMDPKHPWQPGEYTVRKQSTGEAIPVLAMQKDVPCAEDDFGSVALMGLVVATPSSPAERYVLEVLEANGGTRRLRLESISFEE